MPNSSEVSSARKVLIIVDGFPESGGSRTDKFVKYLVACDWEPVVLTTFKSPCRDFQRVAKHHYPGVKIYRTFRLEKSPFRIFSKYLGWDRFANFLQRFFFIPDAGITWVPHAVWKGTKIIRKEKISLIYSTSPPESNHLIGLILKKWSGATWVADFRDLWTHKKAIYQPATRMHDLFIRAVEEYIMKSCDHIIANTEGYREIYRAHFHVPEERMTVITNGYDREDLSSLQSGDPLLDRSFFHIGYMGNFDKHDFPWKEFLFTLHRLVLSDKNIRIRVNICGFIDQPARNYIRANALEEQVIYHGLMNHFQAMKLTWQNDLLLLMLGEDISRKFNVPMKLYNYLIMGKPILALAPEDGTTAGIIRASQTGGVISPRKEEEIFLRLKSYYEEWTASGKIHFSPREEEIAKYDRKLLSARLSKVFGELLKEA